MKKIARKVRGEHAAEHARADRHLRAGAGPARDRQRQHAEAEGQRRHDDRAQAQLRALDRRLDEAHALLEVRLRELHDQDRVLRRQAEHGEQADLEVDVVRQAAQRGGQRRRR